MMSGQAKKNKANLLGLLLIVMMAGFSISAEETEGNDRVVIEVSTIETSQQLFDGELGEEWNELAAYGGDFKKFARVEDKVLVVEVPEGNDWGKTGIRSVEPLVKFPEKGETSAKKLTFTIDQKRSSDFILAIIPSNWDGNLEWRSHQIRVGLLQTLEDSENSSLTLWIRGTEIMKVNLDPDSIQQLSIVMRPDRLILVTDADNKILLQGYMPENHKIFEEGYRISVLAHAPKKGMTAKLALKEITLEDLPYESAKLEDNPTIWLDKSQSTVLFDGRILDKHWIKYQTGAGSNFAEQAHFIGDALQVDVPKGIGWGKVGIMSPEPLIWLDKFGKGAEVRVTYKFDPQQTTGFVVALASSNASEGNEPNNPRALLFLRKDLNKNIIKASLYLTPNKNWDPVWEEEIPNEMPEEVSFILTPGMLTVEASGMLNNDTPWVVAAPSQSFRVYAYSQPEEHKAPVKMALKQISLERKAAETIKPPMPQEGVAPLPVKVLFDGQLNEWWEEAGIEGAEFSKFGRFENNQMIVDVPEKVSGWASAGLLSKKPIIDFNERILSTSHQLKFKVDKQQTTGFEVMFHSGKYANMYGGSTKAMVRFTYCSEGSCAGKYILLLRINFNPNYVWSREVDADWVENDWDGVISIEIGDGWVAAHLSNGPSVRSYGFSIGKNSKLYMTVYSRNHERGGPAKLALEKISSEWVAPDGMTKMDRFLYVDDEDFDASDFVDELNNELSELDKEE